MIYLYLSIFLSIYLSIYQYSEGAVRVYLFYISIYFTSLSIYLSLYLSINLTNHLSINHYLSRSTYIHPYMAYNIVSGLVSLALLAWVNPPSLSILAAFSRIWDSKSQYLQSIHPRRGNVSTRMLPCVMYTNTII